MLRLLYLAIFFNSCKKLKEILDGCKKSGVEGERVFSVHSKQALPGKHRNGPIFALITKNLPEILGEAQTETILICTMAKHWGAHGL